MSMRQDIEAAVKENRVDGGGGLMLADRALIEAIVGIPLNDDHACAARVDLHFRKNISGIKLPALILDDVGFRFLYR